MPLPQTEPVLKALATGEERYQYGLQCVPDDRLNWSPGGAAKSPLQLADRLATFLGFFVTMIRERRRPDPTAHAAAPGSGTREEAAAGLARAFSEVRDVVAGLSQEDLAQITETPFGPRPIGETIAALPAIIAYSQGQLNYCQMAYGDTDANIPPSWRKPQ